MIKFLEENEDYKKVDLMIPVPSTLANREYDPVLTLTRELNRRVGIPLQENALIKTRKTLPQKDLINKTQKRLNVKGAFQIAPGISLVGKSILLIDDLYDSGATLDECTQVLRDAGARKALALTLTRTMHGV